MSTRGARVIRGLVVALVSLLIAAVAHIAGGGRIGLVGFALALAFSAVACVGLSGRTVSSVRVGIAVVTSQGLFHILFGIGSDYRSNGAGHHLGMTMAGMGDPDAANRLVDASPMVTSTMPESGWMLLAHAVAALLTIAALLKGERTFWMLAEWVAYALAPQPEAGGPGPTARRSAPALILDVLAPGTRFLVGGTRHRGPPSLSAST